MGFVSCDLPWKGKSTKKYDAVGLEHMASLNGTVKRDLLIALGGHQEGILEVFKHLGTPLPLTLMLNLWVEKRQNLGD